MANIKIIDLPTGSPESTSFVEATQVDALAESGRSTVKLALNSLGNFVAGQGASPLEYGDLETESTTLIGAANELHNTIGADAYDDTATYNTGDYCIYGGELYKCNDDNVTGAWNSAKWDLTKVVDELGGGGGNADFVECTQAEYDAWEQAGTLDPDVMYFITDGQAGGSLVLPESIAAEYDDTASYTAGDFVMYQGILYKCNHISATGSFDPTKWDAISATDYINSVKSSLNTNISQLAGDLSDAYSSSNTYAVGDLCILGNTLYKCNTAITTPEAWTPAHWTATTIKAELALKQDVLSTTTLTCAYTIAIQSGAIDAYKYGKILVVTGWFKPTYDKVLNDTIAYVSGEHVKAVFFCSPNSSSGLNGRLKMTNQNDQVEIVCESTFKNTDYYSFTLVGMVD